jgi:hypothetical protein
MGAACVATHFAIELSCVMQQYARPREQSMPRGRQLDALRAAHEQSGAEVLFQVGYALTDRRCNGMRSLGRAGDAAGIGNRNEQFQISQVETHVVLEIVRGQLPPR